MASTPSEPSASISCGASSSPPGIFAQVASATRRLERPFAVLLDDLAVELDAAAVPQVLDHVPVRRGLVQPAHDRDAGADREMDRPVHLLVEKRVLHVALDAGVAADAELTEHTSTFIDVERPHQYLFVRSGRRFHDTAALVSHAHAVDDLRILDSRVLGEGDETLGRVLDRTVENLAARHVHVPVV